MSDNEQHKLGDEEKMEIKDINYVMEAHTLHAKPKKTVRKWDGKTPHYIHPIWCATMISTETTLDEKIQQEGAEGLLYHDVLEDTTIGLPEWLSPKIRQIVQDMTFQGGSSQEMEEIWSKPKEVRLYKLYDKVSNLLDGSWMSQEKRQVYKEYTRSLCEDVEKNYGCLNIVRIARSML